MKKKKALKAHRVHKSIVKKQKKVTIKHKKKVVKQYKKRVKKTPVVSPPITTAVGLSVTTPTAIESTVVVPKKRGRKSKNGATSDKMYFTQDTEDSIIKYNATENLQEREVIYNTKIKYPFEKLVENIFNTFKFSYFETWPIGCSERNRITFGIKYA